MRFCSLVIVGAALFLQAREPALDWEGVYAISAEKYDGVARIRKISDKIYAVETVSNATLSKGIGQVHDDSLSIAWEQDALVNGEPAKVLGLTILQRKPSGIVAYWASRPGNGQLNREDWTFLGVIKRE